MFGKYRAVAPAGPSGKLNAREEEVPPIVSPNDAGVSIGAEALDLGLVVVKLFDPKPNPRLNWPVSFNCIFSSVSIAVVRVVSCGLFDAGVIEVVYVGTGRGNSGKSLIEVTAAVPVAAGTLFEENVIGSLKGSLL